MFILASQSPRRAELLRQARFVFETQSVDIDETPLKDELPGDYVLRTAIEKARAGRKRFGDEKVILTADTIGELAGEILVKPVDHEDFRRMHRKMSGATHKVITTVCVCKGEQLAHETVETLVTFANLTDEQIDWYWQTGEPKDKAGGYAIQGIAAQFVERIQGSYSSVVGLPLFETSQLLASVGVLPEGRTTEHAGEWRST